MPSPLIYDNVITSSSAIPIPKSPHSPSLTRNPDDDEMIASSYNPKRSTSAVCRFQNLHVRGPFQSQYPHSQSETRSPITMNSSPSHRPMTVHSQGSYKDLVHYQDLIPKKSSLRTSPTRKDVQMDKEKQFYTVTSHYSSSELWSLEGFEDRLLISDEPEDTMAHSPSPVDQEPVFDMDL